MVSNVKTDVELMRLAVEISAASTDRSRKVGAVIADAEGCILATGINEFPRGVERQIESRHERPVKYWWTEHAERNAIYSAARIGVPLQGATIFIPWFPCVDCARAIVQSGISRVVARAPDLNDLNWGEQFKVSLCILREGGLELTFFEGVLDDGQGKVSHALELHTHACAKGD